VHYDCFESLPTEGVINREPLNSRYDDQIKIYGRDVQEKLGNIKTFMVGAGALGCEYVKAMALMGLSCGPNGALTVTDNDNIEVSNLNRQFLFRKNNVGHSKSATACGIAKEMNPDLKVRSLQEFVGKNTENIFNDEFWESLDYVVNAVDNIKARLYVD
jgi:ubiquitin-activating enzyme E1